MKFRCGHPATSDNIVRGTTCAVCNRIHAICRQHQRDQLKLNQGKRLGTLGQRIASGNAI